MNTSEEKRSSKPAVAIVISVLVSIGIVAYLVFFIDWEHVVAALRDADTVYVVLWLLVFVGGILLRSLRWKKLLPNDEHHASQVSVYFHALNIGNFATMVLPLRAGEFLRPLYFSKWSSVTFPRAFASVVVERVFDLCGMFLMFFLFVYGRPEVPEPIMIGALSLATVCACIALSMLLCYTSPKLIIRIASLFISLLPLRLGAKIEALLQDFMDGLSGIRSLADLGLVILMTVILWFSYLYTYELTFLALGEESNLTAAAVTCVFVGLWIAAPSAPGFLGTFEIGCLSALAGVFSYSKEFSVAYALLAHTLTFGATIVIGIYSLYSKGLSISSLRTTQTS